MDSAVPTPKYHLLAELGHGGMADVYLAALRGPTDFTKLAVVKRLRPHLAEDPDFLAMFLQEARIAARLNHPNVVHTFEVGNDGRHHFIAMEYLQGHSYSALLSRVGRDQIALAIQLRILIESLEGLQHAHDLKDFDGKPLGLVHRDVSPQNIFVTYDGQVKILDFGIAKALDSAVETRTGVIKGKLSYMSPEQALGGDVDRRSDLYAVGVILWEAIAGQRRWKGLSNIQMMKKLVAADEPLELPDPAAHGAPRELTEILKRALARNPDERYSAAIDLQADLESVLDKLGSRVTARDVGKFVAEHFAQDRERVRGVVEAGLKRLQRDAPAARPGATSGLDLPPLDVGANAISVSNTLESPGATEQSAALSLPKEKPTRSRWRFVYGLIALAAAAGLFVFLARKQQSLSQVVAQPVESPQALAPVKMKLSASPAGAELFLDDQRLGSNPHIAELPRGDRVVEVRAELDGYESESREVKLDGDVELHFELKPSAAPEPASSNASKRTTRRTVRWRPPVKAKPETSAKAATTAEPTAKPAPTKRPSVVLDTEMPWGK